MDSFKVKKETRVPEFRVSSGSKKPFMAAGGLLAGLALTGCTLPLGGVPVSSAIAGVASSAYPVIQNKQELVTVVDSILSNRMNISFSHDVLLSLTNLGNAIQFEADGFNSNRRISYEWRRDTYNRTNTNALYQLDTYEIALITNFCFASNFILDINDDNSNTIVWYVNSFADFYISNYGTN